MSDDLLRELYFDDKIFEKFKRDVQTEKPQEKQFYEEIT
jgi:hypothetical protein